MIRKAMIVDDEPFARDDLRRMLSAHPSIEVVCEAGTIAEARKQLADYRPDVIFLDIQLRGGTGFDLLPAIDRNIEIIFITAYDEYAVRAFRINALDYILKPVTKDRLAESVSRLFVTKGTLQKDSGMPDALTTSDAVLIKTDTCRNFVPVNDIMAVNSIGGNYMSVETIKGEKMVCRKTMKEWESILPEALFARIHRSTLINIKHIDRFEQDKKGVCRIFLAGRDDPLTVSVRMATGLKKKMKQTKDSR